MTDALQTTARGNWRPATPPLPLEQEFILEADLLEKAQANMPALTSAILWAKHIPAAHVQIEALPQNLLRDKGTRIGRKIGVYDTCDSEDPAAEDLPELNAEQICQGLLWHAHDYIDQLLIAQYPPESVDDDIPVQPGSEVIFIARFRSKREPSDSGGPYRQNEATFRLRAVPRTESRQPLPNPPSRLPPSSEPGQPTISEPPLPQVPRAIERPSFIPRLPPERREVVRPPERSEQINPEDDEGVMRTFRAAGIPTTGPGVHVSAVGLGPHDGARRSHPPESERRERETERRERPRPRYEEDFRPGHRDTEHRMSSHAESELLSMAREMRREHESFFREMMAHQRSHQDQLFAVHVEQQRQMMAFSAHAQAELRANMVSVSKGWQDLYGVMTGEVQQARESANRANERLFQLNPMDQLLEHQSKANEQGWRALGIGIELRENAATERIAHQQQMFVEQITRTDERHRYEMERLQLRHEQEKEALSGSKAENGGRGKWFRELLPLGAAVAAAVLKTKGHDQAASLVAGVAKEYLEEDEEEEDSEGEEEEVIEAPISVPMAPRPRQKLTEPNKAAPFNLIKLPKGFRSAQDLIRDRPIVALLRMLLVWLDENQKTQIRTILGDSTWDQIEAAGRSDKETNIIIQFGTVRTQLQDPGLRAQVDAVLSPEQRELFADLIESIKKKLE